jgi:hypothetical protein
MGRSRGSFSSRATKLANSSRRAQRFTETQKRPAARRDDWQHDSARQQDDSISISIVLDGDESDTMQQHEEHEQQRGSLSDRATPSDTVYNPLIPPSPSSGSITIDVSGLDGGRAGQPTAPRGQSPTNELLLSAEDHRQQLKQSVDADIERAAMEEEHDADAATGILFGSFAGSSSGSSGSDDTGSQQSDCVPPPAKLWDESSLRWSDYSQPVAENTDATGLRPGTGESIESSASALHRQQQAIQDEQAIAYQHAAAQQHLQHLQQQQQQALAYHAHQQAEHAAATQQMMAFQQVQQQQQAFAMQLYQTQQACYYQAEEQTAVSTPKSRKGHPPHKGQKYWHKQHKQQKQQKKERRQQQQQHGQYNPGGGDQQQRRLQEAGRRKQALRYLNEAQNQEEFLHPPPSMQAQQQQQQHAQVASPPMPQFIPMMAAPPNMLGFVPQLPQPMPPAFASQPFPLQHAYGQ